VRGTNSPRRHDVGVTGAQLVYRGDDCRWLVAHDADFLQANADAGEMRRDVVNVLVAGAAGKDLVADDEHRSRDKLFVRHLPAPQV
jgi:hypothetical protein